MSQTFTAQLLHGTTQDTRGIVVPPEVVAALGKGKRPPVVVHLSGHSWRSTVAVMGGQSLLGIAKEHRLASGLPDTATEIEVTLELDTAPRDPEVPEAIAVALAEAGLREVFDRMAPSHRKEHIRHVTSAKQEATRDRRIAKMLDALRG